MKKVIVLAVIFTLTLTGQVFAQDTEPPPDYVYQPIAEDSLSGGGNLDWGDAIQESGHIQENVVDLGVHVVKADWMVETDTIGGQEVTTPVNNGYAVMHLWGTPEGIVAAPDKKSGTAECLGANYEMTGAQDIRLLGDTETVYSHVDANEGMPPVYEKIDLGGPDGEVYITEEMQKHYDGFAGMITNGNTSQAGNYQTVNYTNLMYGYGSGANASHFDETSAAIYGIMWDAMQKDNAWLAHAGELGVTMQGISPAGFAFDVMYYMDKMDGLPPEVQAMYMAYLASLDATDDPIDPIDPTGPLPPDGPVNVSDPRCPSPVVTVGTISTDAFLVAPNHVLVVGQDPDKRGADLQYAVTIEPTIYEWWTERWVCDRHGEDEDGNETCIEGHWVCDYHREDLCEPLAWVQESADLTPESVDKIENELALYYPGAHVYDGHHGWNPPPAGACSPTFYWNNIEERVQVRDPGLWNLHLNGCTQGTKVSDRRCFNETPGSFPAYLMQTTIIR